MLLGRNPIGWAHDQQTPSAAGVGESPCVPHASTVCPVTHEFRLPDIGEGLTEADIIEWFVAVGDEVAIDQTIVEIETAKTTVEITATHAGTILAPRDRRS